MTSVVGLDIGSSGSRIGIARNRGIDIIVNEVSNRSTPSLVAFGPRNRTIGESAKTGEVSNFRNTIGSLRRLIGRSFADVEVQEIESRFLSAKMVDVAGQIGFEVSYLGEPTVFTVTQLYAMLLGRLRDTTMAELKAVNDVVIAIPGWYTDSQRRAVLDAAEIAGLHTLRLVHDTTATAFGYGITRSDLPDPAEKPKIVAFCDIGHSDFSVALVAFSKGKLVVRGTAYERNFGGRDLDYALAQHFADEFQTKYKIDVRSNKKAMFRLLTAVEKLKKILSANAVAPLSVESIMNDIDASSSLTREDFEKLIAPLLERTTVPLQAALAQAGLTPAEIDSVELVGGSSRVPGIRSRIQDFFGKPASTTTNADEAIARGATFVCATLSPVFRVRDFEMTDVVSYPIEIAWERTPEDDTTEETHLLMFPPLNPQPQAKVVKLPRSEPFDLEGRYPASVQLPGQTNPWIARCTVKNVRKNAQGGAPDIKVRARVDANGIFSFDTVATLLEYEDAPAEAAPAEPAPAASAAEGDAATAAAPKKPARKVVKTELPVVVGTSSLERSILEDFRSKEGEMHAADKLVSETEATKNALEEHTYDMRSKLESSHTAFATSAEKSTLMERLQAAEDWLYSEEGEDSTKSVYATKLGELRQLSDPILFRKMESEKLPAAVKALREVIASFMASATGGEDKYAHISEADKSKVVETCANCEHKLNNVVAKQSERPKDVNPAVTTAELAKWKDDVTFTCSPIMTKPPPIKKAEPAPPKAEPEPASAAQPNGDAGDVEMSDAAEDASAAEPAVKPPPGGMSVDEVD